MEKRVYIALATLLLGVRRWSMTPPPPKASTVPHWTRRLACVIAVVMTSLGYRSSDDFNAACQVAPAG